MKLEDFFKDRVLEVEPKGGMFAPFDSYEVYWKDESVEEKDKFILEALKPNNIADALFYKSKEGGGYYEDFGVFNNTEYNGKIRNGWRDLSSLQDLSDVEDELMELIEYPKDFVILSNRNDFHNGSTIMGHEIVNIDEIPKGKIVLYRDDKDNAFCRMEDVWYLTNRHNFVIFDIKSEFWSELESYSMK